MINFLESIYDFYKNSFFVLDMNKKKINIGPSPIWKKDGWIGLDHKTSKVDGDAIIGDAGNIPVEPKSCSILFCSHLIEHIPHYKFEKCLVEFNRVLEKDGVIRILTPDLYRIAKAYVTKDVDFLEKLREESGKVRTDLSYGGTFMNFVISAGQDTVLFNNELDEFIGGYAHIYLYDFDMLKILLEKYGFYKIEEKNFCESEIDEFNEPLHVEGMEPIWKNLNQKFYKENNLINFYNKETQSYETNFTLTGFDRSPVMSLIIEARKEKDVSDVDIKDDYNFEYSQSPLNDEKFRSKVEVLKKISKQDI